MRVVTEDPWGDVRGQLSGRHRVTGLPGVDHTRAHGSRRSGEAARSGGRPER